ncbi:hypothetical protein F7734_30615 [Scytonema sp. UIC 10036]|uniref:pentapeptide repeat-containing protein n=1 Tax=Scytonema sp. UIC 10036 TaxID=2304196 RepID=UPI0012DAF2C2|nr:pentapeptide repeat-containing protein [Scytonema sp. UIC 10036]MUG96463.1 hypothetical protein [Scytonema sp. UIC 10036]
MTTDFSRQRLNGKIWQNQILSHYSFIEAQLIGCDFSNCDLQESNFQNAKLAQANLSNANMRGADFFSTDMRRVNLRGADLHGCDFQKADFTGTDLTDVNFDGAIVREALFSKCTGLTRETKHTLKAEGPISGFPIH